MKTFRFTVVVLFMSAALMMVRAEKLTRIMACQRGNGKKSRNLRWRIEFIFNSLRISVYGSKVKLDEVRITPCPEVAQNRPCVLKKGTNVTIEVDFTPRNNAFLKSFLNIAQTKEISLKNAVAAADGMTGRAFWANRVMELPLPKYLIVKYV